MSKYEFKGWDYCEVAEAIGLDLEDTGDIEAHIEIRAGYWAR